MKRLLAAAGSDDGKKLHFRFSNSSDLELETRSCNFKSLPAFKKKQRCGTCKVAVRLFKNFHFTVWKRTGRNDGGGVRERGGERRRRCLGRAELTPICQTSHSDKSTGANAHNNEDKMKMRRRRRKRKRAVNGVCHSHDKQCVFQPVIPAAALRLPSLLRAILSSLGLFASLLALTSRRRPPPPPPPPHARRVCGGVGGETQRRRSDLMKQI
ncbi:uncharacterized protein V6R79_011582 [Siganus canaliculatus]